MPPSSHEAVVQSIHNAFVAVTSKKRGLLGKLSSNMQFGKSAKVGEPQVIADTDTYKQSIISITDNRGALDLWKNRETYKIVLTETRTPSSDGKRTEQKDKIEVYQTLGGVKTPKAIISHATTTVDNLLTDGSNQNTYKICSKNILGNTTVIVDKNTPDKEAERSNHIVADLKKKMSLQIKLEK